MTRRSRRSWRADLMNAACTVDVKNLSDLGYVSTQEVICLLRELQGGYRPDLVIFYDGVNDTTSAVLSGEAGLTTNEVNRRREFNLLQSPGRLVSALGSKTPRRLGLLSSRASPSTSGSAGPLLDQARRFRMKRCAGWQARSPIAISPTSRSVETLARGYGFRPFFFWQPTIFAKAKLTAVEQEEAQEVRMDRTCLPRRL